MKWLSVKQAAAYLGLSKETIYRRIKDGSLPVYKVGKLWKFRQEELDQWVVDQQ